VPEKPQKCKCKDYTDQGCPFPVYKDGYCIFHLPKLTDNEIEKLSPEEKKEYKKTEEKFTRVFFELLEKWEHRSEVHELNFRSFQFTEISFSKRKFNKNADFSGARFIRNADFHEARFTRNANFSGTKFTQNADFSGAKFTQNAYFIVATFTRKSDFSGAKFTQEAVFRAATFTQNADFRWATFTRDADFGGATFTQNADFHWATFTQDADFWTAKFTRNADFRETTFKGKTAFKSDEKEGCFKEGWGDFRVINIDKDAELVFEKTNLGQAFFTDTDLERISFRDVTWHRPKKKWPRREKALWEEYRPQEELEIDEETRDYAKLSENYRQLVLNYERKRDFDNAEQFHIGEMEVRRKLKGEQAASFMEKTWGKLPKKFNERPVVNKLENIITNFVRVVRGCVNSFNLYRWLCHYGTSFVQAFVVLVFLFLLTPNLFLISGLKPVPENKDPNVKTINYELCFYPKHPEVSWGEWFYRLGKDYGEAVSHTFSILPVGRSPGKYEPIDFYSKAMAVFAVLALSSQFALMLLAVRRKFKR
jgi:Pentapeptide repeats (9 copies)